jgi:urease gamma subunit
MKKITMSISVVLLAAVFFICSQDNSPEGVVEKYYTHYYRNEFKEIQEHVMPDHRSYFELLEQVVANSDTMKKKQIKIRDIKCDIKEDTIAICTCFIQEGNKEPQKQIIQLKKFEKKWLVNQGKEGNIPLINNIKNEAPFEESSSVELEEAPFEEESSSVESTETISSNNE